MKKVLTTMVMFAALAAFLFFGTTPATAIVDPFVPADECKASAGPVGVQAVIHGGLDPPGAENDGVNNPAGVGAPVPANNPGKSTGARGQTQSNAIGNCAATK